MVLITASSKDTLLQYLKISEGDKPVGKIVEGSTYDYRNGYGYRKDSPHGGQGLNHYHVFKGKNGPELFSVNMDGTGHDGSSGAKVGKKPATYLRNQGVNISPHRKIATNESAEYVFATEYRLSDLLWD
jgi:hypothetical protein